MATNQKKLDKIVEELEDPLNSYLLRCNNYKDLLNVMETTETIPVEMLEKMLNICTRDMKDDMRYTASALSLIPKLLDKIMLLPNDSSPLPSLIASALAVLRIFKLGANVEVDALLMLSLECIKKYPKFVIINLIENHMNDIYEVIEPHTTLKISNKHTSLKFMEVLPFMLTTIILKPLPQKLKGDFVSHGFKVWFQGVIPKLFALSLIKEDGLEECIESVEILTDTLILYDYSENPYWRNLLEKCIADEEHFPAMIRRLVQTGKTYWHRLFIILIKLLKSEITAPSSRMPIKSLLPVVELAFKMETDTRYQAFLCWDALIDNFSSDLVESQLNKRMKLLIIPLKSSNTKVEKTTLAKFNTWWRLIRRYCSKMDKFVDMVLMPFLQFCFGKIVNAKYIPSSGHFNDDIRKLCVQALVEIAGHFQCEGCSQIPKLQCRLMSTKLLVDYWSNWLQYVKSAVLITSRCNSETSEQQMKCLWKSLLSTIAEMPDNTVRKDLVKTLLDLPTMLLTNTTDKSVADVVANTQIFSLFDEEEKFYDLLKCNKKEDGPLYTILFTLTQPNVIDYLQSKERKDVLIKLKPLAHFVLDTKYNIPDDIIERLCKDLCPTTSSMLVWIALADAISELNYKLRENVLNFFLLWPVELLKILSDEITSEAWSQWVTLYNSVVPTEKRRLNMNIKNLLLQNHKQIVSSKKFALCVALTILKYRLSDNCTDIIEEVDLTRDIIKKSETKEIMKIFPLINDTLVLLLNIGSKSNITEPGLKMLPVVLELFITILKYQNNEQNKVENFLDLLLKEFEALLMPNTPTIYLSQIITLLLECLPLLDEKSPVIRTIKDICSKCLKNNYQLDILLPKIKEVVSSDSDVHEINEVLCIVSDSDTAVNVMTTKTEEQKKEMDVIPNTFTTPNSKSLSRKSNKKEPNIVNRVVENGEEFVVVNSNWKFNPRKLTENQKEKLKRKREDIPALYQDLSQSQDEFKLNTWKTDSQDTSNSTSSSRSNIKPTNNDVALILKDIPGNEVVPSIIENMTLHKSKLGEERTSPVSESARPDTLSIKTSKRKVRGTAKAALPQATIGTKSPRMALKDRVFKNVRNLIEKSNIQTETPIKSDKQEVINDLQTPLPKTSRMERVANSAPSKISSERPSRLIKIPKKFDDSEVLVIKKRRRFSNDSQLYRELNDKSLVVSTPDQIISTSEQIKEANITNEGRCVNDEVTSTDLPISEKSNIKENDELCRSAQLTDNCNNEITVPETNAENSTPDLNRVGTAIIKEVKVNLTDVTKDKEIEKDFIICTDLTVSNEKQDKSYNIDKSADELEVIYDSKISINTTPKCSSVRKEKEENSKKVIKLKNNSNIKVSKETARIEDCKLDSNMVDTDLANDDIVSIDGTKTKTDLGNSKNIFREEKEHISNGVKLAFNCESYRQIAVSKKNLTSFTNHVTGPDVPCPAKINTILEAEKKENVLSKRRDMQKDIASDIKSDKNAEETPVKKKTSRIEKQLSIDMVEGHPFLQSPSDKRATRKTVLCPVSEVRRKKTESRQALNNSKSIKVVKVVKVVKKPKDKLPKSATSQSVIISDSENVDENSQDLPFSEDVIESSQDSTVTAISVTSAKHILNKKSISDASVKTEESSEPADKTQDLLDIICLSDNCNIDQNLTEDIELSKNKTMSEQNELCSTESMDTEPVVDRDTTEVQIIEEKVSPIVINTEASNIGPDSQQVAEADTEPMDVDSQPLGVDDQNDINFVKEKEGEFVSDSNSMTNQKISMMESTVVSVDNTQDKESNAYSENVITLTDSYETCSPLKDNLQKKSDFLNDTLEISPIKTMSPIRDKQSPPSDSSSDYVVIKLSSPVQSNGEPFEKNSPEVFTEDKITPEKLDQSPPRAETVPSSNTSPSTSLSLKKNRPQVRTAGRAAQILGLLCAPDKTKEFMNSDKPSDSEENKKSTVICTPARRNLRVLYNTVTDSNENPGESEDSENFLKFKRAIPTPDCSPSGPILKRKLAEICDDSSSPASKRKRVSFHNPPVSTTIAVQKYIEPGAVRSPQSKALKRLEQQMRIKANMKSSKKLDTEFKLETVLTKTVESFGDDPTPLSNDTEMSSIEQTPVVEVIKTSDLNDTDPICKDLTDCNDPIDNIASELSSSGMKDLFVKELKGKVDTIADLAKMTELEVNRLCIKVPKIKTAKKVLFDYASRREIDQEVEVVQTEVPNSKIDVPKDVSVEVSTQTNAMGTKDIEMQTNVTCVTMNSTQTESLPVTHSSAQTNESGEMSTKNIVEKCLAERPDFIDVLIQLLPYASIELLCNKLPATTVLEVLMSKMTASNSTDILNRIVAHRSSQEVSSNNNQITETSFLQGFSKDLILLCSQLVQKIHDKPA